MARSDVIVVGAGIVGTSTALQLARRGLAVALVDRRGPGEETSYGNAGVIGGAGVYPTAFPRDFWKIVQVALKRAPEANYHFADLPRIAPWLWAYFRESSPQRLDTLARELRPLMVRSVEEHDALAGEAGATNLIRHNGWLTLYRTRRALNALAPQFRLGEELGVRAEVHDLAGTLALEPSLSPVFHSAVLWPDIATVSNPLSLTRAYAALFARRGGVMLSGDARSLHRNGSGWRVDTAEGPIDAPNAVVALGPWAPDLLEPMGIRVPFAVKRGYHRHYHPSGNAGLGRPVVDSEIGYVLAPMEQGIRLTTGVEFAARDARPTPVQVDRVMPYARELFPLGTPVEPQPWMGARPCLPDMKPAIGPAPGQPGLWLNFAHNHFGLTLGPVTGRLVADMITNTTPFCDPKPFAVGRFAN